MNHQNKPMFYNYQSPQITFQRNPLQDMTCYANRAHQYYQNHDNSIVQNVAPQKMYQFYPPSGLPDLQTQTANSQQRLQLPTNMPSQMQMNPAIRANQLAQFQAKTVKVDKAKYKTEMCKNWVEYGQCRYGQKCQFAHGNYEMINKEPQNEKYKSKGCKSFNERGFCMYGKRCLFRHEDRQIEEIAEFHFVHKLKILECQFKNLEGQNEKFVHQFCNESDTLTDSMRFLRINRSRLSVFSTLSEDKDRDYVKEEDLHSQDTESTHNESLFGVTRSTSAKSFSSIDSDRSDSFTRDRSQSLLLLSTDKSENLSNSFTESERQVKSSANNCNINKFIQNSLMKERAELIFQ
eukprot:403345647